MSIILDNDLYIFNCPYCNDIITVLKSQINCRKFIHGVYKKDMKQVKPHSKQDFCNKLIENNEIYNPNFYIKVYIETL